MLETEDSRGEVSTVDKDELVTLSRSPENDVPSFHEELEASSLSSLKETSTLTQHTQKITSGAYVQLQKIAHVRT